MEILEKGPVAVGYTSRFRCIVKHQLQILLLRITGLFHLSHTLEMINGIYPTNLENFVFNH